MLITHATLWTFDSVLSILPDHAVLVQDGRVVAIGPSGMLQAASPGHEVIDAGGRILAPGNICLHTHTYSAFARGMALKDEPPRNFCQILERLWWKLDRALEPADVRLSALVCLVDAIRNGTTTLVDHHASPNAIAGSLDILGAAFSEAGVRGCLSYEVTDRGGAAEARAGIEENVRFAAGVAGYPSGQLAALMGLHASLTLSPETLSAAIAAAREAGIGLHVHVAEDRADVEDSLQRYGLRPVERLHAAGATGPGSVFAHCVHTTPEEIAILAQSQTPVATNPRSNMNNAVGTTPVPAMLAAGVPVGLGNDGFTNDMYREMATAYLVHKDATGDPRTLPADQVIGMAYSTNAAVAGALFGVQLGRITPCAAADLVLLDYDPPTPVTPGNLPWHVAFGLDGGMVRTTIVAGRVLMRDRVLLTLDEEAIMADARAHAAKVWERL